MRSAQSHWKSKTSIFGAMGKGTEVETTKCYRKLRKREISVADGNGRKLLKDSWTWFRPWIIFRMWIIENSNEKYVRKPDTCSWNSSAQFTYVLVKITLAAVTNQPQHILVWWYKVDRRVSHVHLKPNTDFPDWCRTLLQATFRDPTFFHFVAPALQNLVSSLPCPLSSSWKDGKEHTAPCLRDLLGQVKKDAPVLTILWLQFSHTATITTRKYSLGNIVAVGPERRWTCGGWLLLHSAMGKVGNKGREGG